MGTEAPLERRRRAAGRAEVEQAWSRPTRPPSAPSGPRAAPPRPSTVRAAAVLPPAVAAAPIGAAAAAVLARIACGVVVAHTRCRTRRADRQTGRAGRRAAAERHRTQQILLDRAHNGCDQAGAAQCREVLVVVVSR